MRIADRIAERAVKLDQLAMRLVGACERLPDILAVYVYGSYARGTIGMESDLDALIVRETSLRRLDRGNDIRREVFAPEGLDLLVVTPAEFATEMPCNIIGQKILAESKLLKRFDRYGTADNAV